jgi:aminoglycoside phosphotransferase
VNAADAGSFDIANLAPPQLLGEGVWGRVYDLGDGTVLKIARETCAGIGSGRAKIENECAALMLLSEAGELNGLVPVVRGRGDIPAALPLVREGFAVWLRMTKMPGRRLSPEDIDGLPRHEQSVIGRNIGVALVHVHRALGNAVAIARQDLSPIDGAGTYAEITTAAEQLGDPLYTNAIAQIAKVRRGIPSAVLAYPTHGDFNTSNLLVAGNGNICGIIDFAEWGADFPEKDFAHVLQELPALSDEFITSYECESGFATDPLRVRLALAENALFGAVISERQKDVDNIKSCRRVLTAELKKLAG